MSLIDFKTKFKSIKFGKDRKGGGSSNQPYITKPIPDNNTPPVTPDSVSRGGLIAVKRSAEDVSRLSQMFIDTKSPSGLMFIPKMNLLSRMSVKTEASDGLWNGMGVINQGVYTPLSTLTQAGGGIGGFHTPLFGLDFNLGEVEKYGDVVGNQNVINDYSSNRLRHLLEKKMLNSLSTYPGVSNSSLHTLEYEGGPGSTLGVGKTQIPITKERTNNSESLNTLSFEQQFNRTRKDTNPQDFRKELDLIKVPNSIVSLSPDYKTKNASLRTHHGDPGGPNTLNGTKDVLKYGIQANDTKALDKINALQMYSSSAVDTINHEVNDLVKFRISSLDNNNMGRTSVYMHFRAFIDSFSDSYAAQHSSISYSGRGDNFYNYRGFNRTINLSFKVVAQSKRELIPMYRKLNYLASNIMPDYSPQGFMRGNILKLTLGGYLYEQPGIINNLTFNIPNESTWEIGIDEEGGSDNSVKELPHIIEVTNFSFTPIHEFLAKKPEDPNFSEERYIALSSGGGESNYEDVSLNQYDKK